MDSQKARKHTMPRRDFLKTSVVAVGTLGASSGAGAHIPDHPGKESAERDASEKTTHPAYAKYDGVYKGDRLNRVAFPMGGLGAGMICLEGTGALSHFSIRNKPEVFNEPCTFAAICIKRKGKENVARILEGPVPAWKLFGAPGAGNGAAGSSFGLPRFREAVFQSRFPFATVTLTDPKVPIQTEIMGWSPFEPGDADNSSLPACGIEYRFTNPTRDTLEGVFSFNSK